MLVPPPPPPPKVNSLPPLVGMMSNMILFHDLAMHAVESTAHSENKITWNMIHDRMRGIMYELTKMKFMVRGIMYELTKMKFMVTTLFDVLPVFIFSKC